MEEIFDPKDLLFIGIYGHIKAIDKRTGEDRWETSLPATGYDAVSVICEGFIVYAGSKGYVFGLDARTGAILWTNSMPGLGYEQMSLAVQVANGEPPPMIEDSEQEEIDISQEESDQAE